MRESYNYWLNRINYFGDGLAFGLIVGILMGLSFGNMSVYAVVLTFLGGAIGAMIKKKDEKIVIRQFKR